METRRAFKRRRSRKRFENIPSLPKNLSVHNHGDRLPLHREREVATDRNVCGGTPMRFDGDQSDPFTEVIHKRSGVLEEPADGEWNAFHGLEIEWGEDGEPNAECLSDGDPGKITGDCIDMGDGLQQEEQVTKDSSEGGIRGREVFKSRITDWRILWGVLMTTGSQKVTRDQYKSIRTLVEASSISISRSLSLSNSKHLAAIAQLPHYSTIQKRVKPFILRCLSPRVEEQLLRVDLGKAGARKRATAEGGKPVISVRMVLPSEYARADVATPELFSAMRDTSLLHSAGHEEHHGIPWSSVFECIDTIPIISSREWFYGPPTSISVDMWNYTGPYSTIAEAGDVVCLSVLAHSAIDERVIRCFDGMASSAGKTYVTGEIQHVWTVHHHRRKNESEFYTTMASNLTDRDKQISTILNFVTYETPADAVSITVPELPVEDEPPEYNGDMDTSMKPKARKSPEFIRALKERRQALKRKRIAEENAWRDWTKPLIKPGDTVALLSPDNFDRKGFRDTSTNGLLTSTDKQSRLCLVFRFWPEHDERSRHVFWIPGGADLEGGVEHSEDGIEGVQSSAERLCCTLTANGCRYLNVTSISLATVHGGKRGPRKTRPTSSLGELGTGEAYFVYRFILYWDGFEVQAGKSATGEGIYMLCLNLPTQARSTPSAVRIISLTPPGVKSASVLEHIMEDIVEGMSNGFVDYDAFGTRRRIFLDLVGVIGDTPALNAVLDVMGHTGAACCHLCRMVRRSGTMVGSRFTSQSYNGFVSACRRSFYQHAAVSDCGANAESCRILGIKPVEEPEKLILHRLRAKMLEQRGKIPKTSKGAFVVPCALDPYRASFVAPDHVLTGHLRDCINLVLRLLPSPEHRVICEKVMISLLETCGLPKQNRLVDHNQKKLYSMSMTELYALSLVAEISFRNGVSYAKSNSLARVEPSDKCISAIELVGSACRLIAELWYLPRAERNGSLEVSQFGLNSGWDYISKMQGHTLKHIALLESVCRFEDSDFNALEDSGTPAAQKSALSRIRNECAVAIRTVDKPNVHRIVELVNTTLPMLGHVSLFGELVLEKAHQCLKRALRTSNQKDAHLQAMDSAVLNDWQGRLAGSAPLVYEDNDQATRVCFRLLMGREAVFSLKGQTLDVHRSLVLQALGPAKLSVAQLQEKAIPLLSRRYILRNEEKWALKGLVEQVSVQSASSTHCAGAISCLKVAYPLTWSTYNLSIANSIACSMGPECKGGHFPEGTSFRYSRTITVLQPAISPSFLSPRQLRFRYRAISVVYSFYYLENEWRVQN